MAYTINGNYTNNSDTASGTEVKTDLQAGANSFNAHEASTTEHGATGANVGTTNVQTLTNKTINSNTAATTTYVANLTGDSLTTGSVLDVNSASSNVSARSLVKITNDDAAAVGAVNLRIQQDSTGDMLQAYDAAVLTTRVTGAGTLIAPMLVPGQVQNLSLTLSGTTLTIAGAGGTALSATNPGWICLTSDVTPGTNITTSITANQTLDLTAIDGFEFGITASVNWANDMPFFVKMARSDADAVAFFISRSPISGAMPVANSIGDAGADPVTDDQNAHIAFTDITPGDYDGNPCYTIGAFRMQYTGATTRWAVQTMSTNDGFGQDKVDATCATTYTFPAGQNGAQTGTYIISNAGTEPTSATSITYTIARNGQCGIYKAYGAFAGGVGADVAYIALPYTAVVPGVCGGQYMATNATVVFCSQDFTDRFCIARTSTEAQLTNATLDDGAISWSLFYKAF